MPGAGGVGRPITGGGAEGELAVRVAVTVRACVIETVHAPEPEQSPDQPAKLEPASAAAVSVTLVPDA
jgi:hypothetical protein